MFHSIRGVVSHYWEHIYIETDTVWVAVQYAWSASQGHFHLHPQIDVNYQTIKYYAFDAIGQKDRFTRMLKISWIWGKVAYTIAFLPDDELFSAIESADPKYFQKLPWVGPKTAKRLLVELKGTITKEEMQRINGDQQVFKNISWSLQNLGYSKQAISEAAQNIPFAMTQETLQEAMKRFIDHL